ncbi:MAG: D-alanyl-D-alanine carboxypeptidase [Chromatiales bacterium]|nr:D-alanyl-D-alanine carboxypeptidase [Chromatiales bacterium]
MGWLVSSQAATVIPAAPSVDAPVYLLIDSDSGHIISHKNTEQRVEPASLTKIMTEFVVFSELKAGRIKLSDELTVSRKARLMGGSRMFLEAGSRVPIEAVLKGVIVQSGNDASVAIAEHVGHGVDSFAVLMNQHASSLGMTGSHFVNPHGLPHPEHYTTARDMAKLARALIARFPRLYAWHSMQSFEHNGIKQKNRNRLLWSDGSVDGVKTGFTEAAGYCLVASAKRSGMRLISVVMGTKSAKERIADSKKLLDFGFRNYETHRVFSKGQAVTDARVWQGVAERVELGLEGDLVVTVPKGEYKQLKANVTLDDDLTAPISKGTRYGNLTLTLNDSLVAERTLVSLRPIEVGSLWQRLSDRVRLMLE